MLKIGCHLSSSNGFTHMIEEAKSIDANVFQFFTRNPRGGKAKEIDKADVEKFLQIKNEDDFGPILAHAPYTLNPCSADERTRAFAHQVMADDLERMEFVPGNMYNFHPGSHVGQGIEKGISLICETVNDILKPEHQTKILLETMAGKGSEVGSTFEELKLIIDGIILNDKIGVCLDTCHIYDAGYDIANDLDGVLDEFDRIIGLDRLCAIHLNDSKNPFESHKDRHEKIGDGNLGLNVISSIINNERLKNLPFYLETPNDVSGYQEEIKLIRSVVI